MDPLRKGIFIHEFDVKRPYPGWPKLRLGEQSYPVYRSQCTGALLAAPSGIHSRKRYVRLPGEQRKARASYDTFAPLHGKTDPRGRPLYVSRCRGTVVSFSKNGSRRYYWPAFKGVKRVAAVQMETTSNPRHKNAPVIRRRHVAAVVTLNPRAKRL